MLFGLNFRWIRSSALQSGVVLCVVWVKYWSMVGCVGFSNICDSEDIGSWNVALKFILLKQQDKSDLISCMSGSPGVGQNLSAFSMSEISWSLKTQLDKFMTVRLSGSDGFISNVLSMNVMVMVLFG